MDLGQSDEQGRCGGDNRHPVLICAGRRRLEIEDVRFSSRPEISFRLKSYESAEWEATVFLNKPWMAGNVTCTAFIAGGGLDVPGVQSDRTLTGSWRRSVVVSGCMLLPHVATIPLGLPLA
jgi:hypothetical protein